MPLKPNARVPSFLTFGQIALIFITSYFGRDLFHWIVPYTGRTGLQVALIGVLTITAFLLRLHRSRKQLLVLVMVAIGAKYFLLAEELLHIVYFGGLGMCIARDISSGRNRTGLLALGFSICLIDELFQAWLPWRVGDIRDIVLNVISLLYGYFAFQLVSPQPSNGINRDVNQSTCP